MKPRLVVLLAAAALVAASCGDAAPPSSGADETAAGAPPEDAWTFTAVVDASSADFIFAVAWEGWFLEDGTGMVTGRGAVRGRALGECDGGGGVAVPYEFHIGEDFVVTGERVGESFELVVDTGSIALEAAGDTDRSFTCVDATVRALEEIADAGPGGGEPAVVVAGRGTTSLGSQPFTVRFILSPPPEGDADAAGTPRGGTRT